MQLKQWVLLVLVGVSLTGCSIKHEIAADYGQYLTNNIGNSELPSTKLEADYVISEVTGIHDYRFRAAMTGVANLWIVRFGKMLEDTLQSSDVQAAFGRLTKQASDSSVGSLISFDLQSYQFSGFAAHIKLKISLKNNSDEIFSEIYSVTGRSQGGKMFWGGVFGMRNAIQQSTKYALDDIMTQFIEDVNEKT